MPVTRLNSQKRERLKHFAEKKVGFNKELVSDFLKDYNKVRPKVLKEITTFFDQKEMEILKKYGYAQLDPCIAVVSADYGHNYIEFYLSMNKKRGGSNDSVWDPSYPVFGKTEDVPLVPNKYATYGTKPIPIKKNIYEEVDIVKKKLVKLREERMERLKMYTRLINSSTTLEQVHEIWAEVEEIWSDIAVHNLPASLSNEMLQSIRNDVANRKENVPTVIKSL